jgi:predicted RNase H-like nuclease (RuvC/YqgF family)
MDDEKIILKIRRQYTDNEKIKLLNKEIERLNIEIGQLKSDIHELEDTTISIKDKRQIVKLRNDRDYWMQKALSNKM